MACFRTVNWIVLSKMKILTTVKSIEKHILVCLIGALILVQPVFGQTDTTNTNPVANDTISYTTPELSQPSITCFTPPDGFQVSEAFNGYIHFKTSSTILIQYISNVTYVQIAEGVDDEFFSRNNLTLISQEDFQTKDGVHGKMYTSSFTLKGDDFVRIMVYMGDLNNTLWLNITYPKMVEPLVKDLMIDSIKSVQFKLAK